MYVEFNTTCMSIVYLNRYSKLFVTLFVYWTNHFYEIIFANDNDSK